MGKVKPWQIVVLAAAVVALGASVYLTFGRGGGMALTDEIVMVDVTTGQLFSFPVGGRKAVMIPALNPETGKATLLQVYKREDGKWALDAQSKAGLGRMSNIDAKAVVDRESGEVRVASETPKRMS